ncbi:transcriptional regulator, LysR family [Thalassotalea agarivorans]|uniref:Transcriptional regulator, LysR family n=2 Tax=Thalassotalea agarivorans TaxID=349064 RepID=A0A1I0GB78_THASX|nr:transcriptional regulator, LysR family [Thalassotalea agarivorans]
MMVFLAVVETGSFTLAAERLGIPKANVSRRVSKLEKSLNAVLLERSTRSQHLTEAGQRFVNHCKRIQQETELAKACVSTTQTDYSGQLKIGASVSIGHEVLKSSLAQFLNLYPKINMHLSLLNRRVNFVEEGFDVVIRVGKLDDSNLIAKKLGTVERKLFASRDYLNNHAHIEEVADLSHHRWMLMNPLNNDQKQTLVNGNQQWQFDHPPRLFLDDFAMLKQSILDEMGVACIPAYMVENEVQQGLIKPVLPQWGLSPVDIYALYPKHRSNIVKVAAFLEFIATVFDTKLNKNTY